MIAVGPAIGHRAAIAACAAIAARNDSTLFHAARLLPRYRRDLFAAAYAAMRVIDDAVDEGFLLRPPGERGAARPAMLAEIEAWRRQTAEAAGAGPLPVPVAAGFRATVGRSDLGPWPWDGLASALAEDAAEAEMPDWTAFERYAEGATVAPAAVFVYLLACRFEHGHYRYDLPASPQDYARDLGIFCYLVHILRDLAKDAGRRGRLVTIPAAELAAVGLDRVSLGDAVGTRDHARLDRLAATILARAEGYRRRGRERLADLVRHLGPRERLAL
ncbi:MAG TPA: squalene/phytoene synthase family protein, partial [Thalassobaculum sp.]